MDSKDAYKIIDEGWVKKRVGYRVRFERLVGAEVITDYFPDLDEKPWMSDVATWRMARRLAESRQSDPPDMGAGDLVNVTVVDHEDNPVRYYATNQFEVFNRVDSTSA